LNLHFKEPLMRDNEREDRAAAKGEARREADLDRAANRDPITGAPGAHPLGVGVGATAGGIAAGAAVGTMAGPVGTAIGAAVGAIAGGLVGKSVSELVDPTLEDAYWRSNYQNRPYVPVDARYEDYAPAYRYGVTRYAEGRSFDDAEADLAAGWDDARGDSRLAWDDARHASRDAWDRVRDTVERATPGDSDHDGL
jgi:hypothetical protein